MEKTVIKIFDSHFHIIDNKYHLEANNGYLPDYLHMKIIKTKLKTYL